MTMHRERQEAWFGKQKMAWYLYNVVRQENEAAISFGTIFGKCLVYKKTYCYPIGISRVMFNEDGVPNNWCFFVDMHFFQNEASEENAPYTWRIIPFSKWLITMVSI